MPTSRTKTISLIVRLAALTMKQDNDDLFPILTQLLEPLARLCIKRTISIQDLTECAKQAMITAAAEECAKNGEEPSMSHLSNITGLHRRDVARIHVRGSSKERSMSVPMRVVGLWLTDGRYSNSRGRPKILSYGTEDSQFSKLVTRVSKNIHAGSVLAELERLGIIEVKKNELRLKVEGVDVRKNLKEALRYLAMDISDLMAAVEENVGAKGGPANLHATTEFDNIPADKEKVIRRWVLNEGARFHRSIRKFLAKHDKLTRKDLNRKKPSTLRVSVGTFSHISSRIGKKDS